MNDPDAALRRLDALARSQPERLAAAKAAAEEHGRQQVRATSSDEHVTVTVDGRGTIISVEFSATALRRLDTVALGERAAEAINAALDRAQGQRPASDDTLDRAVDDALETLNQRLDSVLGELDEVERTLEL
jgi:DNA-binding protein YbaB